jgi:hypothetical protein
MAKEMNNEAVEKALRELYEDPKLANPDKPDGVTATELAQRIFGKAGRAKYVNPQLYKLEKKKRVLKLAPAEGSRRPRWRPYYTLKELGLDSSSSSSASETTASSADDASRSST